MYGGQRTAFRTFHLVGSGDQTPVAKIPSKCLYSQVLSLAYFINVLIYFHL